MGSLIYRERSEIEMIDELGHASIVRQRPLIDELKKFEFGETNIVGSRQKFNDIDIEIFYSSTKAEL